MRKIVEGYKNEDGSYEKGPKPTDGPEPSLDSIIREGLINLQRIMSNISAYTAKSGIPDRELVASLKDTMSMLFEYKKREKELMDELSDDELKKYIK